jgi:hypothetical protein
MARAGMSDLITQLRALTVAGTADYSVGITTYWSDDQLQTVLDQHRTDFSGLPLSLVPRVTNGIMSYYDYYIPDHEFIEGTASGMAAFTLADSAGGTVAFSAYTLNLDARHLLFSSDTLGTVYYLRGRAYDLYRAASAVWERKAADVWDAFDLKTDNHDMTRSQKYDHALKMAKQMRARGGWKSGAMVRSDVWGYS